MRLNSCLFLFLSSVQNLLAEELSCIPEANSVNPENETNGESPDISVSKIIESQNENDVEGMDLYEKANYHEDDEDYWEDDDEDFDDEDEDFDEEDNWHVNSWGSPQIVKEMHEDSIVEVIAKSEDYMTKVVFVEDDYESIRFDCRNLNELCSLWASEGECEKNSDYMVKTCSPACQTCDILREEFYEEDEEEDEDEEGKPQSADKGMIVPSQFGVAQNLGEVSPEKVRTLMDETYSYMMERVFVEENFANIRGVCQNRMADCSIWAASGECERNTGWMSVNCAPACQTCERLDFDLRCPVDPNLPELLENPGDLNRMFERITTDPFWEKFGPIDVISSPAKGGPWIVTFDNFVSDEECNALIEYGYAEGYKRSEDVGDVTIDGTYDSTVSDHRTSKNAWLLDDGEEDPITGPVVERIMTLAGAPYNNSEWLQLLKYEPGEYYLEHHDYIVHEAEEERPQGPRILTVFLYLNDVEAGGGTHFGPLGITVMPKKGRALVWPSVLDEDPWEMDERTHHEALKVEAGVKYGANAWIHLRDFKKPYEQNCV